MIYLIIGHRGVGKTLWLKKLKKTFRTSRRRKSGKMLFELSQHIKDPLFIDLDQEIEKKTNKKISNFFSRKILVQNIPVRTNRQGKKSNIQTFKENKQYFRLLENKILEDLTDKYKKPGPDVFIAVGAGFQKGFTKRLKDKISRFCRIIHLIRETDPQGRVFLNRPRLTKNKSAYEEYMSFYPKREKFYRKIKTQSFVLPEQDFEFNEAEKLFFGLKSANISGIITLNKSALPALEDHWPGFIEKRLSWGLNFFELRDDELSLKELKILLKIIPHEKQLLSFRKKDPSPLGGIKHSSVVCDWPLEKGAPPARVQVLSLHKRDEVFSKTCKRLTLHKASHFKLAVPVKNFKELMQGHLWFLEDPKRRSFLPRSFQKGRWRWYRQIFGPAMKLHFIRESRTGEPDQPFLYEHLLWKNSHPLFFAAVLGDPVAHSKSPAFHRRFFAKMPFVKIPMNEKEFTKENLYILQKMGLRFSAVTSPLKKKAFAFCDIKDLSALKARAVNTLIFKEGKWLGSSTDGPGLRWLLSRAGLKKKAPSGSFTAVWGGGGMEDILRTELPFADFYSARTGRKKTGPKAQVQKRLQATHSSVKKKGPDIVIWAVGRNRMSSCVFPPRFWKPKQVIDLNYTEDSPGREYALLAGAGYLSGEIMFENQAKKQQSLFLRHKKQTTM